MEYKNSFIITGFGPFYGVKNNPSATLVDRIKSDCKDVIATYILDVSIESVMAIIQKISQLVKEKEKEMKENERIIILHLGVDPTANQFWLEKGAKNLADFSCEDNNKNLPKNQPIDRSKKKHVMLRTNVNVERLRADLLNKSSNDYYISISDFGGSFISNYIYYMSLWSCQSDVTTSLYVHVPPFNQIRQIWQQQFVSNLLDSKKFF